MLAIPKQTIPNYLLTNIIMLVEDLNQALPDILFVKIYILVLKKQVSQAL